MKEQGSEQPNICLYFFHFVSCLDVDIIQINQSTNNWTFLNRFIMIHKTVLAKFFYRSTNRWHHKWYQKSWKFQQKLSPKITKQSTRLSPMIYSQTLTVSMTNDTKNFWKIDKIVENTCLLLGFDYKLTLTTRKTDGQHKQVSTVQFQPSPGQISTGSCCSYLKTSTANVA